MNKKNKIFESKYIVKAGNHFLGFDIQETDKYVNGKSIGNIILRAADVENRAYAEISMKDNWLFLFSEIISLYNNLEETKFYSHQWAMDNYILRLTHFENENTLIMIKHNNSENTMNIILERTSYFELLNKIIEAVQNIKNFKFSFINIENPKENLSLAKIESKSGTIITTFNGVSFGKPHLSESDKYQIKYSAIHRILFGRWLTVHTERVNISFDGIITTVDTEYILDQNEKNKSSLAAIVLLACLSFEKEKENEK